MITCPTCKNEIDSDDYWAGNQCLRCALDEELRSLDRIAEVRRVIISDGFGNTWDAECPHCGGEMQVVRPGDARCGKCDG